MRVRFGSSLECLWAPQPAGSFGLTFLTDLTKTTQGEFKTRTVPDSDCWEAYKTKSFVHKGQMTIWHMDTGTTVVDEDGNSGVVDATMKDAILTHERVHEGHFKRAATLTVGAYEDWWDLPYVSCLLYTSPSPRDRQKSRMPSSA